MHILGCHINYPAHCCCCFTCSYVLPSTRRRGWL